MQTMQQEKLTFSERLLRYRNARNLSQKEAAARLGVTRTYVCLLEKGREPGNKIVNKLTQLETESHTDPTVLSEPSGGPLAVITRKSNGEKMVLRLLSDARMETLVELLKACEGVEDLEYAKAIGAELARRLEQKEEVQP